MDISPPDPTLRLAAIVESSDDAIVSKDLNGIITSWNRGAEMLFGYSAEEAIGRSITMVIPEERLAEEDMVLGRIRRGDRVDHFETVRRRKDGQLIDISLTVSPIHDPSGKVIGASKIARDITERKRILADLQELHQRVLGLAGASASILGSPNTDAVLSTMIEVARDTFSSDGYAVWRLDRRGEWRMVRAFGVSDAFAARAIPAESNTASSPVPFSEPLIVEDVRTAPVVAPLLETYEREGVRSLVVFPLTIRGDRTGTMVFYSRRPRTYRDTDVKVGTALANLAAAALTTAELYDEQRTAREAADEARRRAMFLADAGTVLSASLDYEVTMKSVARLAVPTIADWCAVDILDERGAVRRLAIAHCDPDKVELARQIEERYPPDPNAPGSVHEVIRSGQPAFMARIPDELIDAAARDVEHLRLIRELNLTSYMCVPLAAHGRTFGAITFASAESGREYSDADFRLARELAVRASLAVDNARAYQRANEASRLKDDFLATLSHELRTPLNAVLGYARMLRLQGLLPERAAPAVDTIERNATALKQIIEDVLDISRIVAGRLRLNVEPVDLPGILHEAVATVMPAAEGKGVRIETVLDLLNTPVSGDPDRIQQIVWNLLSNAIKFTPRGGKVQLRLTRVDSHIEITVSDTGIGITQEFLPYVFERFRQADSTVAREHGGLGLGLSIARQLAELHGGTITASSGGRNRGATFTVRLPLMIVHAEAVEPGRREQPHADRTIPGLEVVPRLEGVRVLAVDDEPDSLNLLRSVLEGAGATVTTARSAAEAMSVVGSEPRDVVIADIGMPGTDGLQLIRAIRRMEEPVRSIPAAALTAYARSQDRITSLASGFQIHLVKPIDPLELIVAIATLARRHVGTS